MSAPRAAGSNDLEDPGTCIACYASVGGSTGGQKSVSADDLISSLPAAKGDVDKITWNLTGGEPETLDPADAATPQSGQVVRNLCDSLLTVDAKFNVKPNLASYDQRSPTKAVLTIRPGTRFWDGSGVTAEDVAFSLRRAANPSKIVSCLFASVGSVKATAADQVTVTFRQPDEMFRGALANMVVVTKAFAGKAGTRLGTPSGGLMCSGPFRLDSWTSGDSITMSRKDAYWNRDDGRSPSRSSSRSSRTPPPWPSHWTPVRSTAPTNCPPPRFRLCGTPRGAGCSSVRPPSR
ncbi:ABC transporter substrate-binding protein [Streptomyces sp. NPDC058459]|uniref:ABC transporter substrate-binding protein n=1 Tax=Streptomyces sp. NPDC058459 TaxID=3346508 RepID=UPI00365FBB0D